MEGRIQSKEKVVIVPAWEGEGGRRRSRSNSTGRHVCADKEKQGQQLDGSTYMQAPTSKRDWKQYLHLGMHVVPSFMISLRSKFVHFDIEHVSTEDLLLLL